MGNGIQVQLTPDQEYLYYNNALFRQGLDSFLRHVLPQYIRGLQIQAVEKNDDYEKALKILRTSSFPGSGPEWQFAQNARGMETMKAADAEEERRKKVGQRLG